MNILTTYWNLPAPPLRQWYALIFLFDILVLQVRNSAPKIKSPYLQWKEVLFFTSFLQLM